MGNLSLSRTMSREFGRRRFFVAPPEPPASFLLSPPSDSVYFGKTKLMKVPFYWTFRKLTNPHIAVLGITGSGKSYFVKTFLTRASLVWGANALIIDWAGEYPPWVRQAGGKVISLGKGDGINLLDLGGMKPSDRAKQVMSGLEILTDISDFSRQRRLTEQAIEQAYSEAGFDLHEKPAEEGEKRKGDAEKAVAGAHEEQRRERREPPTLKQVHSLLRALEKESEGEKREDAEQAAYRIGKFCEQGSDWFAKQSTLNLESLTRGGLVCLDLHGLPSEQLRSLAGLTVLQYLKEKMREEGWKKEKGVRLFVVIDEAWKIASDDRSDVISIVREGRKYQFGLVVASQNPTDINKQILSNVGTMLVFKLILKDFKDHVRSSLNYSSFIAAEMDRFGVGEAAVHVVPSEKADFARTFLMGKIDGEEPLTSFRVGVGEMELEFEKDGFKRRLVELGLADSQMREIASEFEKSDYRLSALSLISLLEKYGYDRSVILSFLREIGVRDAELAGLFSKMQRMKMGFRAGEMSVVSVRGD